MMQRKIDASRETRYYIKIDNRWYLTVEAPTYGGKAMVLGWSPSHPEQNAEIIKELERQLALKEKEDAGND